MIRLDLHRQARPSPWLGLLLLIAGAAFTAKMLGEWALVREEQRQLAAKQERVDNLLRQASTHAKPKQIVVNEPLFKLLQAQKSHAVRRLTALEAAWSEDVAVIQLQMQQSDGTLTLEIEGRSMADALSYQRKLIEQSRFDGVTLLRHRVKNGDASLPVTVNLEIRDTVGRSAQR